MNIVRKISLASAILLSFSLVACQKTDPTQDAIVPSQAQEEPIKVLSIGYQKSSLNLLAAKEEKIFEKEFPDARIEWREFPAGPQMLEALSIGAVDFAGVGNTPPIFAQAADKALSYVGYETNPLHSQAILIPNTSPIQSIEDLKGKRIAVQKGSSAHELLAKVLQKAGLSWKDIQPTWLPPADARAAFDQGAVDAWSIWEPYQSTAELKSQARPLIDGKSFPTTYTFYIGSPQFLEKHPSAVEKFLNGLNTADQWVLKHPNHALHIYVQNTGLDIDVAKIVLEKRLKPSPISSLTPEVIHAQQEIADTFFNLRLIPNQIKVEEAVWPKHDS